MDSQVLIAAVPVFFIAALAMPAGVGGGLLYVPVMLLLGVVPSPNAAAALSQPIVAGAALAANLFNLAWQRRHPGASLVQTELALAILPPALAGATAGTFLNQMMPPVFIILLLVLVITWNLYYSLNKGLQLCRKENEMKSAANLASSIPAPTAVAVGAAQVAVSSARSQSTEGPAAATAAAFDIEDDRSTATSECQELDTPHSSGTLNYYAFEASDSSGLRQRTSSTTQAPAVPVGVLQPQGRTECSGTPAWLKLLALWLILLVAIVLRGGKGQVSLVGIAYCSWQYWAVTVALVVFLLVASMLFKHPDISVALCFFVGALSACVGIGGGLVLNPMLLSTGLDATKTTATVALAIIVITSSATSMLALAGAFSMLPMIVLSLASFLGSLSGKVIIGWAVSRTGRNSILVFLLSGFLAISGSAVVAQGGISVAHELANGLNPFMDFRSCCS